MKPAQDISIKTFGPPLMGPPVVSVNMVTYNHEPYIRQAIESVFEQDFDGPMELVIGEDSSTDNTRAIIEGVCRDAPILVRLLTSERNVGAHANAARTLGASRGEFVAFIEGDDYWTAPHKLTNQLAVLRKQEAVLMVCHRVLWLYADGKEPGPGAPENMSIWPSIIPSRLDFSAVAQEVFIQNGSVVCRREALASLPPWIDELPWGDWAIYLYLALKGRLVMLDSVMSVYRQHGGGATATMSNEKIHQSASVMFRQLGRECGGAEKIVCRMMEMKHLEALAEVREIAGRRWRASQALARSFAVGGSIGVIRGKPIKWIARLLAPSAHGITSRLSRRAKEVLRSFGCG